MQRLVSCAADSRGSLHHNIRRREALSLLSFGGAAALWTPNTAALADTSGAEEFSVNLDQRVHEFTLANGLHFIVLERHQAPIVSFQTYADVGAYDEVDGQTGVAHLLEHLAFKGTERIGTRDYRQEAALLDALDEVFYSMRDAQLGGQTARVSQLDGQFRKLQDAAGQLSVPNAFGSNLQRAGAVGLNATTSHDATKYFTSLPANMLELWFALEAERFQAPVFRELYSEKRVVAEERRLRIDNAPMGKFQEEFAAAALANNYRRPIIGYAADVEALGRREVQSFFEAHYGPRNLTIAIVGDVRVAEVERLAAKYFGGWRSASSPVASPEAPAQAKPRESSFHLEQAAKAGPVVLQAYYRPNLKDRDAIVLDIISDLLSGSRTSRLVTQLVQTGRAFSTSAVSSYPAEKHPCTLMLYGIPAPGTTLEDMDRLLREGARNVADAGPSPNEMKRIKKAAKLTLINSIQSNASMASLLTTYHALTGSWRNVLVDMALVESLTPDDIRATAGRVFREDNCFTGYVLPAVRSFKLPVPDMLVS
ncbi:hypothetical protein WJX72_004899 [[Myrmecia] bisecta]|uniref:Insulinase family protein n=1 Tax=[Myrmecia] bisecta TaxID=41462 RepID=A0AAW1R721_9CHLO